MIATQIILPMCIAIFATIILTTLVLKWFTKDYNRLANPIKTDNVKGSKYCIEEITCKCGNCGGDLTSSNYYCPKCGYKLAVENCELDCEDCAHCTKNIITDENGLRVLKQLIGVD